MLLCPELNINDLKTSRLWFEMLLYRYNFNA